MGAEDLGLSAARVGEGTRLFGGSKAILKLVDTKTFSAEFTILTCRPVQRT